MNLMLSKMPRNRPFWVTSCNNNITDRLLSQSLDVHCGKLDVFKNCSILIKLSLPSGEIS